MLALVSLFTDMASEMLYPVMPIFLKSIGFSVVLIGVLEGLAETTAGLSKGYFGQWSDNSRRRLPFVQIGYALSAVSKPMMALLVYPWWIFLARTLDRLGKGVRTGARDALLADESAASHRGRVFGFHRAMDTLGAVLGPGLALLYLYRYPEDYKTLFFLAFIPGLLAIAFTLLLREKKSEAKGRKVRPGVLDFFRYWRTARPGYRRLVGALLVFALFNSSDLFLLLQLSASGLSDQAVIGAYIFYNLVYAAAAYPLGMLADRIGMRRVFVVGLVVFAVVYGGMATAPGPAGAFVLFFFYGIFAAATEGVAKAWITRLSDPENTATAIGAYTAFQSVCAFLASTLAGVLWYGWGAPVVFLASAGAALSVAVYLGRYYRESDKIQVG